MDRGFFLQKLYRSVQLYNVLPLTSACSLNCVFCSHRFQIPGVEIFRPGHLETSLLKDLITYLSPQEKIVIGESATRIEEGEPFLHPDWREIMGCLREFHSETLIKITTSGCELSRDDVKFLSGLRPLNLCLSVNFISPQWRKKLLGASGAEKIRSVLEEADRQGITVEGSLIALPDITGWGEIYDTVSYLESRQSVGVIRIFRPGYTRRVREELQTRFKLDPTILNEKIASWRKNLSTPVFCEPQPMNDLQAKILGVIPGSPAARAGLKKGDEIISVDGNKPLTRVEAFEMVNKKFSAEKPFSIEVKRLENYSENITAMDFDPELIKEKLQYPRELSPGLVMADDISPGVVRDIKGYLYSGDRPLFLTAPAAEGRINQLARLISNSLPAVEPKVKVIQPDFMGGNISCAGLLVNRDISQQCREIKRLNPDKIFLPGIIYDDRGRDLIGGRKEELQEELPATVITV